MNVYDKIYLIGKSLPENESREVLPSDLFVCKAKNNRNRNQESFSDAVAWAITNGLISISPKTNKLVVNQHSLVRSDALQKEMGVDRFTFRRLVARANAKPLFREPGNGLRGYFTTSDAKAIMRAKLGV
jgi:hypothetical protein